MALQDTWRGRIDQNNDLLSLGSSKAISFPGDGEDGRVLWKSGEFLSEKSNVRDSSAVISPVDAVADRKVTSESSEQSGSTLKEHDYIGMAEVNSASSETLKILCKNETSEELNLKETDLCLGLGLALTPSKVADTTTDTGKSVAFTYCQLNDEPKPILDTHLSTEYVFSEGFSPELRSLQARRCNSTSRTTTGDTTNVVKLSSHHENIDFQLPQLNAPLMPEVGSASRMGNVFQGSRVFVHPSILKNGLKRGFSEVASDVATFSLPPEARAMNAMAVSSGDADVKSLSKQSQKAFLSSWSPTKPLVTTSWQAGLEQSAALPYGVNQAVTISRVERSVADATAPPFNGNRRMDDGMQEPPTNEVPTRKDRVVGWPPIRSYRKVTLAKPTEMFVKVNMDGITVGRKVDINAHSSYEGLLSALEDMFQPSNNAPESSCNDSKHFRLFNGSDYVLTYEDKDGDWMLVGDVPWSMFTTTVRRLRITRGLEATGPGPRGKEKVT